MIDNDDDLDALLAEAEAEDSLFPPNGTASDNGSEEIANYLNSDDEAAVSDQSSSCDYMSDDDLDDEEEITEESLSFLREMAHISDQDLTSLIAYSQTYLEILENLISKTDRALDDNREAQEIIHEKLADTKDDSRGYVVNASLYVKPYFRDLFGMTPASNSEAEELIESHQLTTLLKEERIWSHKEIALLRKGVYNSMLNNMNLPLRARRELVEDKILKAQVVSDGDKQQVIKWQEEVDILNRKIDYNNSLSYNEVFTGDYSKVCWQEVSITQFNGFRSAIACRMRWCNEQCPQINKDLWTPEEDAILKQQCHHDWTDWKFVVNDLGTNRSEFMCMCRAKVLEAESGQDKQPWTIEEDEKLLSLVYSCRNVDAIPWNKLSRFMDSRSSRQCRDRYLKSLKMTLRHGRWCEAEDLFLLDAVNRYGPLDWGRIADCVPGRSHGQCRNRWHNVLDTNRTSDPWSPEEDEAMLIGIHIFGRNKFMEVSELLPKRNPADTRCRFRYFLFRKISGKKYKVGTTKNQFNYMQERKKELLTRFQDFGTRSHRFSQYTEMAKRFGIGNFLIGDSGQFHDPVAALQAKMSRFGKYHIYRSGLWKVPKYAHDFRSEQFQKFMKTLPEEKIALLNAFQDEITKRKVRREQDLNKAITAGMEEECQKRFKMEDHERLNKLIDETIVIEPRDLEFARRQKLPRISLSRHFPMKRTRRRNPAELKKIPKPVNFKQLVEQCRIIRDMPLSDQLIRILKMPHSYATRPNGMYKLVSDLVLMQDHNGHFYWASDRQEAIFRLANTMNTSFFRCSISEYENAWRNNAAKRAADYYREQLKFDEVISLPQTSAEEPTYLENYEGLLNNVLLPNRGTMTAVQQYRIRGRTMVTQAANHYFDTLDSEGNYENSPTFSNETIRRLDIRLNKSITGSVEYLLLRARMFKMFFFPMLLEYSDRSPASREFIRQEVEVQKMRRLNERLYNENGIVNVHLEVHTSDSLIITEPPKLPRHVDGDMAMYSSVGHDAHILECIESTVQSQSTTNDNVCDTVVSTSPRRQSRKRKAPCSQESDDSVPVEQVSEARAKAVDGASTVQMVMLDPSQKDRGKPVGAYKPRWITRKLKGMPQRPDGELTLGDLLFVRGIKKRAATGLYNKVHNDDLLGRLQKSRTNRDSEDGDVMEVDQSPDSDFNDQRQIKNEMLEQ